MFGFLHVALLIAFLSYHIQTTCPLNEPCTSEAGITCNLVHKFAPQLLDTYNAIGIKLPDPNDYAYFQELKKASNDFLGIKEKEPVVAEPASSADEDTFATSPSDETVESQPHVHDEQLTPENEEVVSEQDTEVAEVPVETAVAPVAAEEDHIPSEQQKIVEKAEEFVEEALAAEAIELAAEVGANI